MVYIYIYKPHSFENLPSKAQNKRWDNVLGFSFKEHKTIIFYVY